MIEFTDPINGAGKGKGPVTCYKRCLHNSWPAAFFNNLGSVSWLARANGIPQRIIRPSIARANEHIAVAE